MPDRISCCVPFCRRTCKAGRFAEWICSVHWPMVPRRTRTRRATAKRLVKRASDRFDRQYAAQGGCREAQFQRWKAADNLARRLWDRCKVEAIQAAAGIS